MCRSRVLMLNQKSHFYSVQLFEEEVRKDNPVHLSGSVHDKLFTQTALCKWLRRWRNKSSVWACFFKYIFPFMWWRSPLSSTLCCSSSSFARPLCVSWQRRANGKLLVPLLPFCFSGFFPTAVVGHALPAWLRETAVRIGAQLWVWERRRVCLLDQWCCVSDIFLYAIETES